MIFNHMLEFIPDLIFLIAFAFFSVPTDISKNLIPEVFFIEKAKYTDLIYKFIPYNPNQSKQTCPLCQTVDNHTRLITSTNRDCVIAVGINTVQNVFPFIRTLRTTKSNSSAVLIFDERAFYKLTPDTWKLLKNCSVNVYNLGSVSNSTGKNSVFAVKHLMAYDFIIKNWVFFDRILLCDLTDVFFQQDPFFEEVNPYALTVVEEPKLMKNDKINRNRVTPVLNVTHSMGNYHILNGGIFYGGPEILVRYENLYFRQFDSSRIDETHKTCDQGYLNAFQASGLLEQEFPIFHIWGKNQGFHANVFHQWRGDLGSVYLHNVKMTVCHMYDRSRHMTYTILRRCSMKGYDVSSQNDVRRQFNSYYV